MARGNIERAAAAVEALGATGRAAWTQAKPLMERLVVAMETAGPALDGLNKSVSKLYGQLEEHNKAVARADVAAATDAQLLAGVPQAFALWHRDIVAAELKSRGYAYVKGEDQLAVGSWQKVEPLAADSSSA